MHVKRFFIFFIFFLTQIIPRSIFCILLHNLVWHY